MSLLNPETTSLQTKQGSHGANGHDSYSELKNIVANITESLKGISSAFTVYNECSDHLMALPPQYPSFKDDVGLFSQEINRKEQIQGDILDEIKDRLDGDIKKEIFVALEDPLFGVIKEEAATMVKSEVDNQIRDYLPVSLQEQAEESRKQLRDIKISLENSAARMHNSFIELGHLEDPLKHVFTPSGESNPYYPSNLKMLFGYDLDSVKALNKAYGLVESEDIRLHFQQFLKHVGAKVDVVTHDSDDTEEITLDVEI